MAAEESHLLATPQGFTPLYAPLDHPAPLTFAFRGGQLLVRASDAALPPAPVIASLALDPDRVLPVGRLADTYVRAAWVPDSVQAPDGFEFRGLRSMFGRMDDELIAIAGRAFQVADWARTHRFCGACGKPTHKADGERAMRCECGHVTYPRIAPAMMVLVKRGPAILLARNVAVPAGGRMSALAGFLDPGESVEDAVHREVREEVGLEVAGLRYFGSQSWPFPGSLMIAYTAEYAGGDIVCDPAEIAEARFFGPGDKLPDLPPAQSISRALIEANLPR
jgi:NAD+ diphosphatase